MLLCLLQYAHARVSSILRKARETLGAAAVDSIIAEADPAKIVFAHASDVALALEVARFQEVRVNACCFPRAQMYWLSPASLTAPRLLTAAIIPAPSS